MSGISSRTMRSPTHCYCGENLALSKQKHNAGGGRHIGQCIKGENCPLQELGNGHWYKALEALQLMDPIDRNERYPHLQLRSIELLVEEHARKRERERCTPDWDTQQTALPTTTTTSHHRDSLLNSRLVSTTDNRPSQHANEGNSSLTETLLINPLSEFEDWQQQGHSDTFGACEGTLSESNSSSSSKNSQSKSTSSKQLPETVKVVTPLE